MIKNSKTAFDEIVAITKKEEVMEIVLGESKDFKTYNRRIKKVEGCDKCKFHSWRVFANTTMQKAGIDRAVRMKILGHKVDKDDIHSGYTSVDIQQMKKAIDKIP